jgi:hypothetical protein
MGLLAPMRPIGAHERKRPVSTVRCVWFGFLVLFRSLSMGTWRRGGQMIKWAGSWGPFHRKCSLTTHARRGGGLKNEGTYCLLTFPLTDLI